MLKYYLKYLNKERTRNYLHLLHAFNKYKRGSIYHHPPLPFALSIEPNNSCNFNCPACPVGNNSLTRPTGEMSVEELNNIIEQTSKHLFHINLYFQGEPLLHPKINEMLSLTNKHKIFSCVATNGSLLKQKYRDVARADHIIVSVDGLTQDSYSIYRKGGELEQIRQGIEKLSNYKKEHSLKTPYIEIQCLATSYNEKEWSQLSNWAKQIGANKARIKSLQIYDKSDAHLLPKNDKYSRYKINEKGSLEIKSNLHNYCWRMFSSAVITWDGNVLPCCFDKNAEYIMGNINKTSFREIWYGSKYQKFRKDIALNRLQIAMCNNCSEGLKIKH